jgi:hypothetical protein
MKEVQEKPLPGELGVSHTRKFEIQNPKSEGVSTYDGEASLHSCHRSGRAEGRDSKVQIMKDEV